MRKSKPTTKKLVRIGSCGQAFAPPAIFDYQVPENCAIEIKRKHTLYVSLRNFEGGQAMLTSRIRAVIIGIDGKEKDVVIGPLLYVTWIDGQEEHFNIKGCKRIEVGEHIRVEARNDRTAYDETFNQQGSHVCFSADFLEFWEGR